jgi:DNA polymerase-3 subunit epsilon
MDEEHARLRVGKSEPTESRAGSNLENANFAALDLETTGLDIKGDEIISIAIIPMTGFQIHFGRSFYSLIKPIKFYDRSIKIHGICPGDLKQAPTFVELCERILGMLMDRIIVGFNVIFDIAFLKEHFKKIVTHHRKLDFKYVDIKEIEVWILQRTGRTATYSLNFLDLIENYQIERGSMHNALSDAYIAARIFQKQLNILSELKIGPHDLSRIGTMRGIF